MSPKSERTPGYLERQAVALERIADLLEGLLKEEPNAEPDDVRRAGATSPEGPTPAGGYATVEKRPGEEEAGEEIPEEERIDPLTDEEEGWQEIHICGFAIVELGNEWVRCGLPKHDGDAHRGISSRGTTITSV